MATRKSISKKVRFDVFKRDLFACQYCGAKPPAVVLEVDHIIPVASGGNNETVNLITSCFDCNRGKGANSLGAIPQSLDDRAAVLEEKKNQIKAYERLIKSIRRSDEKRIDEVEDAFKEVYQGYSFSPAFRESVRKFISLMTTDDVCGAMRVACGRIINRDDAIKYFCGICWKMIREAKNA